MDIKTTDKGEYLHKIIHMDVGDIVKMTWETGDEYCVVINGNPPDKKYMLAPINGALHHMIVYGGRTISDIENKLNNHPYLKSWEVFKKENHFIKILSKNNKEDEEDEARIKQLADKINEFLQTHLET